MQIFATGTVRTNRKGLDKRVTMKKEEERQLKRILGQLGLAHMGVWFMLCAWFDKRPVHILSICHPSVGEFTVDHWYTAKRGELATTGCGKILKQISICPIVYFYQKWMGAVNRFDQFRAYIKLEMRTGKFWHVMFLFFS